MSDFRSIEPYIVEQAIDETSTTQKHPLGTIIRAKDVSTEDRGVGEFIYLKGVASTAVGTWVGYNAADGSTTRAAADGRYPLAIAMSANVANQYGWYQISGDASGLCLASYADNGKVFLTGTAGSIDDASVAGDFVVGAKGASARDTDTGLADFELSRPVSTDVIG